MKWILKSFLGFGTVNDNTNFITTVSGTEADNLTNLGTQLSNGYEVILLINSNMIKNIASSFASTPTHWVVLESIVGVNTTNQTVTFKVSTWGDGQTITISYDAFSSNYYGYFAFKK